MTTDVAMREAEVQDAVTVLRKLLHADGSALTPRFERSELAVTATIQLTHDEAAIVYKLLASEFAP